MRSLFSNRYNNKRKEFYERYEAARALHPSLPLYERPKELRLQVCDRSRRRRFKTYQELKNQSTEKYISDDWLTNDRLSIVVRRTVEERNFLQLMPKYDPKAANHEFSHNARFGLRGRRPTAASMAKIVTEFAKQVGAVPTDEISQDLENDSDLDTDSDNSSGMLTEFQREEEVEEVEETDPLELVELVEPDIIQFPLLSEVDVTAEPLLECEFSFENKENIPIEKPYKFTMPPRIFICPEASCRQEFEMRRCLSKHQHETGHHSWSHKCDRCGQIFRTAGFMRMHALGACDRNLLKKNIKHETMPK